MSGLTLEVVTITSLNLYTTPLSMVGAIRFQSEDCMFRLLLPKPLDVAELRQLTTEVTSSRLASYDEGVPGRETKLYGIFGDKQATCFMLRIEEDLTLYLVKVAGRFVSDSAQKWMADINHSSITSWSAFQLAEITGLLKAGQLFDYFLASLLSTRQKTNLAQLFASGGCSIQQLLKRI